MNNGFFILISCYSIYFVTLFAEKGVHNDFRGRDYTTGDGQAVFFGIFIGLFAVGMAGPNFKAINTGRLNGHEAMVIIERKSKI